MNVDDWSSCKEDYMWNLSTCDCKCNKKLGQAMFNQNNVRQGASERVFEGNDREKSYNQVEVIILKKYWKGIVGFLAIAIMVYLLKDLDNLQRDVRMLKEEDARIKDTLIATLRDDLDNLQRDVRMLKEEDARIKDTLIVAFRDIERLSLNIQKIESGDETWHLGMNLNPGDGHIMDYLTGWEGANNIGVSHTAFTHDYLNIHVWTMLVNNIAIVRHQKGFIEAVKVWQFTKKEESMMTRFKDKYPGRKIATKGGPKQVFMVQDMANDKDDPIFSVPGDLAINWRYGNNGVRIALTGGHLSADVDDDNTHGFGNHFALSEVVRQGWILLGGDRRWRHEISNIQNCPIPSCPSSLVQIQGTDHGEGLRSGPVYGNYAIYVSKDSQKFPINHKMLKLEMPSHVDVQDTRKENKF